MIHRSVRILSCEQNIYVSQSKSALTVRLVLLNMFKSSSNCFIGCFKVMLFCGSYLLLIFHICLYYVALSIPCSLLITCLKRSAHWALLSMMYYIYVTFPYGISGQVWYLIVSIPNMRLLHYFDIICASSARR